MPLMVTFFNVRKGRDAIFKRGMRHLFPRTVRRYEEQYGIRFLGWFNVSEGSDWNNVVILDLPSYGVLDRLYADPATRGMGHRIAETVFDRKHTIFLRERMGPDLVYKP
ncbi:MAG: hypothetical protein M3O93_03810 [Chloroflexota bacterium]|jgi:hypothetical protein|nr:hypothetical protein [Chloroflexota bacterium]